MKQQSVVAVLLIAFAGRAYTQSDPAVLQKLSEDFWAWRAAYAPFTGDDVNRIERPGGVREWSRAKIDNQRKELSEFEGRWKKIDPSTWAISQQVEHEILTRIENIPSILQQAIENLTDPPAPFASVAAQALDNIRVHLHEMAVALLKSTTLKEQELYHAADRAADALEKFRQYLKDKLPALPEQTALGRDAYVFFTKNVALLPYSPGELLAMGNQEWNRAVAFETDEKNRNIDVPPLELAKDISSWIKTAAAKELAVRKFLEDHNILTVPDWLQHYTLREMPAYLRALQGFGETDDFTSPSRLKDNCIRYVTEPSGNLGYFWRATAMDPRPICVHEGLPGHYFQLCLSWKHEDAIRRHYYASTANEGIGFYAEEMMLQAGLFDDSPHTREIIYNFMRLRALRVEVDVKLALGEFTLDQAAKYLQEKVPMDSETARQEAIAFATSPGGAISYQIGKLQIVKLLADARLTQGKQFNLRAFHDFVWKNGNVPIALQRWEHLGDPRELPPLGR